MKQYGLKDSILLGSYLRVITKHWQSMQPWEAGKPVEIRMGNGTIDIRYENGTWWRYDLNQQTWIEK